MSRIKYGIDLGTTNSAIAVIEKGESVIIKNERQKDMVNVSLIFILVKLNANMLYFYYL